MKPALLILAAGMGSRYGGLKQLDGMGPGGETILEYSVYDALQAGFGRIVFVVREAFADAFRDKVLSRLPKDLPVDLVFQELDSLPPPYTLPPERIKPWGTAHAVWVAANAITEPFGVLNADDFYGRPALKCLADYLIQLDPNGPAKACLVAFPLGRTISAHGSVSRGIVSLHPDGSLKDIEECTQIIATPEGPVAIQGENRRTFSPNQPVSMNCFGFSPAFFTLLDQQLRRFLTATGKDLKNECYLPATASLCAQEGNLDLTVLQADSPWLGVTYPEDKPFVAEKLQELSKAGEYPQKLF